MKKIYKKFLPVGIAFLFTTVLASMSFGQFGCGSGVVVTDGFTQLGITTPGTGGAEDWNVNPSGTSINNSYWEDDVYLFEYTAGAGYEEISMSVFTRNGWNGVGIFDDCNVDLFSNEIDASGTTTGSFTHVVGGVLSPGQTVYIAVGQWGSPNDLDFDVTDFTVTSVPCPDPFDLTATNVSSASADLGWTEFGSATSWNIEWGASGFTLGGGTTVNGVSNPHSLSGLTPETTYEFYVQSDCGADQSAWVGPFQFTTTQVPVSSFPWDEDFETGGTEWDLVNGTETNQWFVGTAINNGGANALYISDDGGTSHNYDNSAGSAVFAYRDISLPASMAEATLTFDWLCDGESSGSSWDFLNVFAVPTSFTPTLGTEMIASGTAPTGIIDLTGVIGEEVTFQTSTFQIPPAYAGQTFRLVFQWENDGFGGENPPAVVDNVNITLFNCAAPSGLVATDVESDGATLSWDDNSGGAATFIVEYGPAGFTQGTGTTVTVTTDTFTVLTGLIQDQDYDYYVSAECSGGTFSQQSNVGTFTTLISCDPVSNLSLVEATTSTVELTWNAAVGYSNFIIEYGPAGFTPGTGTQVAAPPTVVTGLDDNTEYDFYVYSDCGAGVTSQPEGPINVTTPALCPAPTDIVFTEIGTDSVVVSWTSNGSETDWVIEIDTAGFTPGTGTIVNTTNNPDTLFGLDQFTDYDVYVWVDCGAGGLSDSLTGSFTTQPTCLEPTNITASNTDATSTDIGWTVQGTETSWNVEYGAPGYTPGSGTSVNTSNNPETITGLTPQTTYDFYVQADCGGGDTSVWSGPISVTTGCGVQTAPYTEDFENGGSIPACWEQGASNAEDWEFANSGFGHIGSNGTINGSTNSNGYFAWVDDSSPHSQNTELLSPFIDVSSLTNVAVSFFLLSDNEGDSNVDFSLDVWDGAAWNDEVFTSSSNSLNEAWEEKTAYLNSLTITGPIQLRFVVDENNGFDFDDDVAIDDVSVFEGPTCTPVSNIMLDTVSVDYAEVSWTNGDSETSWNIEYDTTGFLPGTGTVTTTGTNPFAISGLTSNTTYDVYITADCGGGDLADTIGAFTFTTDPSCGDTIYDNGGPNGDYSSNTADVLTVRPASANQYVKVTFEEFEYESSFDGVYVYDGEDVNATLIGSANAAGFGPMVDSGAYWGTDIPGPFEGENLTFQFLSDGSVQRPGHKAYIDCYDCDPTPGVDATNDVCQLDDTLNLNNLVTLPTHPDPEKMGAWSFAVNPGVLVNDSLLVVTSLASGTYEAVYILNTPCGGDTTIATINVFGPSNAGQNGTLEVCQNEPINLFDGLSGNADLGGTWLDPSNNPIAGSQPTASSIPGSYNYDYIASNGVCPADTALVEVIVRNDCDWLSIGEEKMNKISVFPNPATSVINIANPSNSESLKVEILDMNGRVVLTDAKALANATEGAIDISHLVKGMYTLRVYNEEGQKTFKVVKQ